MLPSGFHRTIHYGILPIDQSGLKGLSGQAVSPLYEGTREDLKGLGTRLTWVGTLLGTDPRGDTDNKDQFEP